MAEALESLLDEAHAALLSGDLAALDRLRPEIEDLADAPPRDRVTLERLKRKAARNATLMQAAERGVRAAIGRLAEISRGPVLSTYDARGQKSALAPVGVRPLRRV